MPKGAYYAFLVSNDVARYLNTLLDNSSSVQKVYNVVAHLFKWRNLLDLTIPRAVPGQITAAEVNLAKEFWIKFVQSTVEKEIVNSVKHEVGGKVHGRYRRLSLFKDDKGIWRVGLRLREYAPFTYDKRPPAFLPAENRLTLLLMEKAHRQKHAGVEETVARFRMSGFWTPQASKLAKSIKSRCVTCKLLDKRPEHQLMGGIPRDQLSEASSWSHVEMDLFGPFVCRSDVNKRSTIKVWGIVLSDKNTGATHCDIVMNYSAAETLKTLRRFAAIRGWPLQFSSDPGSQLESASGKLESWWMQMRHELTDLAAKTNFSWNVSPANSPWRQGSSEVRIKN